MGHHRSTRDPGYADAVRARLSKRTSPSGADLIWLAMYGLAESSISEALHAWLLLPHPPGEAEFDALERALQDAGTGVSVRVLLTQHPHSGALFEWSTPPMS